MDREVELDIFYWFKRLTSGRNDRTRGNSSARGLNFTIELSIYNAERRQQLCFRQREKTKEWSQDFSVSLSLYHFLL